MVAGVDERGIDTNATDPALRRIEAATKIWAAGVQASPLGRIAAEAAGAVADRAGRVQVRPGCTLPGHPEVFVVGDLMALDHLPGLAQVSDPVRAARCQDDRPPAGQRYRRAAVPLPRPGHRPAGPRGQAARQLACEEKEVAMSDTQGKVFVLEANDGGHVFALNPDGSQPSGRAPWCDHLHMKDGMLMWAEVSGLGWQVVRAVG
jgi:hypothetical protein